MAESAFHPGEYIQEELAERGMSQRELAGQMGRPYQTVNEIVNGKKATTAETAIDLERVFGGGRRDLAESATGLRSHDRETAPRGRQLKISRAPGPPPASVITGVTSGALDWRQSWAPDLGARWDRAVHSAAAGRVATWLVISALSSACWMVCEILGGLAFLAAGIRLWTYEMVPILGAITSPVIWLVVFVAMTPFMAAFGRFEALVQWSGLRQVAARVAYLMAVGPVVEVLISELFFKAVLGRPLYAYELLPVADGSGSLLSPFYYLTLYIHYPVTALVLSWLVARPGARPPRGGDRVIEDEREAAERLYYSR